MGQPYARTTEGRLGPYSYYKRSQIPAGTIVDKTFGFIHTTGPALAAVLSTRTNDTDGILSFSPGHGIEAGDWLDIYWNIAGVKGRRVSAAVIDVTGNDVTFEDGFEGDNLPVQGSNVIAKVPEEVLDCYIFRDTMFAFGIRTATKRGIITFIAAAATVTFSRTLEAGESFVWDANDGANPISGILSSSGKVRLSHDEILGTSEMRGDFLY